MMMLGREVRLPAEVLFGSGKLDKDEIASYGDYVTRLRERMSIAHHVARKHLGDAAVRRKTNYDAKSNLIRYKRGSMVWFLSDNNQLHITPKLRSPYEGPFLVLKRVNDLDYIVQVNANGKRKVINHNRLKPYQGDQDLTWAKQALNNSKDLK
jgi:hypothetical protein